MKYILLILMMIIVSYSCSKDPEYRYEAKFQEMLDHLELDCPNETSNSFFKAIINGTSVCYYDGVNGMSKEIKYFNSFTTSSPNSGGVKSKVGHVIGFGILKTNPSQYLDWIEFTTPLFGVDITKEQYLDSLFAIPYHKIMDRNNPQGLKVSLNMFDASASGHGGLVYAISTKYGYQYENDFIHFVKVDKTREGEDVFYDIEMEVQAGLYYLKNKDGFIQYGKEGLWGRLENGLLKMKVKI